MVTKPRPAPRGRDGSITIPDVCGPSWWAALEGVTKALPALPGRMAAQKAIVDGINCPSCRAHGLKLLSGMHDLQNFENGKRFHDPKNFVSVATDYGRALEALRRQQVGRPRQISFGLDDTAEMAATQKQFEAITRLIREAMERGVAPWRKPWGSTASGLLPQNAITKRRYHGINVMILALVASERGYGDPRWLTYKQAEARGGHVRKGEVGTTVQFWKIEKTRSKKDEDPDNPGYDEDGKPLEYTRFIFRMYTVFNVEQCDDLKLPPIPTINRTKFESVQLAERVVAAYLEREKIPLAYGGDQAYYVPSQDRLQMPPRETFESADGYYSTILHELSHSTGHTKRLNRKGHDEGSPFGTPNYSKEELVAEFSAAFLTSEFGVDNIEPNAAYIKFWLGKLDGDPGMFVYGASAGERAANYILGDDYDGDPDPDQDGQDEQEKPKPKGRGITEEEWNRHLISAFQLVGGGNPDNIDWQKAHELFLNDLTPTEAAYELTKDRRPTEGLERVIKVYARCEHQVHRMPNGSAVVMVFTREGEDQMTWRVRYGPDDKPISDWRIIAEGVALEDSRAGFGDGLDAYYHHLEREGFPEECLKGREPAPNDPDWRKTIIEKATELGAAWAKSGGMAHPGQDPNLQELFRVYEVRDPQFKRFLENVWRESYQRQAERDRRPDPEAIDPDSDYAKRRTWALSELDTPRSGLSYVPQSHKYNLADAVADAWARSDSVSEVEGRLSKLVSGTGRERAAVRADAEYLFRAWAHIQDQPKARPEAKPKGRKPVRLVELMRAARIMGHDDYHRGIARDPYANPEFQMLVDSRDIGRGASATPIENSWYEGFDQAERETPPPPTRGDFQPRLFQRMGQPKVAVRGTCTEADCKFTVRASDTVTVKVSGPEALRQAIDEVSRRLEGRTHEVIGTSDTFAVGANGVTRYAMRFRVLDLHQLIASHDPFTFEPNPAYPAELQPRLRDRAATRLQVDRIAANLEPDSLLTDFRTLDRGAPIIGPDYVVESGNGRIMAIKKASEDYPEVYAHYVAVLTTVAPSLGIAMDHLAHLDHPVLVRERLTEVDRKAFAEEGNTPPAIGASAIEQARTDAEKITPEMLEYLFIGENQSIEDGLRSNNNRQFVQSFLSRLPDNEQSRLVDGNGRINQDGIRRMTLAVFVSAFQSGAVGLALAEMAYESIDLDLRNVINGIGRTLGPLAKAEGLTRMGARDPSLSIGENLGAAIIAFRKIKQTPGMTVKTYLSQSQLFSRELTVFQEQILTDIDARSRSAKKIATMIRNYADAVIASPPPGQTTMIDLGVRTAEDLWASAVLKADADPTGISPGLFSLQAISPLSRMAQQVDPWGSRCRAGNGQWQESDNCPIDLDPPPPTIPGPTSPGPGVVTPLIIELAGKRFAFLPETLRAMDAMAASTKGFERAFHLCPDDNGNITPGVDCRGGKCSVRLRGCKDGRRPVGFFHTHPDDGFDVGPRQNTLSVQDLHVGRDGIACVGGNRTEKIVCAVKARDLLSSVPTGNAYPYIHPDMAESTKQWIRTPRLTATGRVSSKKLFSPSVGKKFDYVQIDREVLRNGWNSQRRSAQALGLRAAEATSQDPEAEAQALQPTRTFGLRLDTCTSTESRAVQRCVDASHQTQPWDVCQITAGCAPASRGVVEVEQIRLDGDWITTITDNQLARQIGGGD